MVSVSLFNKSAYQKFESLLNENVLTGRGRCLFPSPVFGVTGLEPRKFYRIVLAFKQVGNKCEFKDNEWKPTNGVEYYEEQSVQHEFGVASGEKFMNRRAIEFKDLRVSNSKKNADKNNIVVLHTMHKYLPVLKIYEVRPNETCGWENVDNEPMEFSFEETLFLTVTIYKSDKVRELKTNLNKFAHGTKTKRKCENSEEELNEAKRRQQEKRLTENLHPSNTLHNNVSGYPNCGPVYHHQFPAPNQSYGNQHYHQQQYVAGSSYPLNSSVPYQNSNFAVCQSTNAQTNQLNTNYSNYPNFNTGTSSSTITDLAQHYFQLSFHSANRSHGNNNPELHYPTSHHNNTPFSLHQPANINQMNVPNYTPGANFPTPPHQGNTPGPTDINHSGFVNYNFDRHSPFQPVPIQNSYPATPQHFDNAVPAMNNFPHNATHSNLHWCTSQQQQAPQNFNQQHIYQQL